MNNAPQGKGKAIAAMVLGIVAIIIAWFPFVSIASIILSIIGLVLAVGFRKANPKGSPGGNMATAGLVLCVIALVLSIIGLVACTICAGAVGSLMG